MSLSRRQFGKAALTSAALVTTGAVGFPRAAYAANTSASSSTTDRQDATFRVTS